MITERAKEDGDKLSWFAWDFPSVSPESPVTQEPAQFRATGGGWSPVDGPAGAAMGKKGLTLHPAAWAGLR